MGSRSESFIKLPEYPGGTKALNEFIKKNVRLPELAIKHKIKGVVQLKVSVNYKGLVDNVLVTHSVGYGCDEEAIRVARKLEFLESFNRGLRVSRKLKLKIPFDASLAAVKVPPSQIKYSYVEKKSPSKPKDESNGQSYGYTINLPS